MKGHSIIVGRSTLLNYCYNKILTTLLKKKKKLHIYIYIYMLATQLVLHIQHDFC